MNSERKHNINMDEKLAIDFINKRNFVEAEKIFKNLVLLEKNNPKHYNNLGNVQKELRKLSESKISFQKAIEISPRDPDIYINLGTVFKTEQDLDKAIYYINKGIQLKPKNEALVVAFNNIGNIYATKKNIKKAFNYYKKALDLNSKYIITYYNLGNLYEEIEDFISAINCHKSALNINKNFYYSLCKIKTLNRYICDWQDTNQIIDEYDKNRTKFIGFLPRDNFFLADDPKIDLEIARNFCNKNYIYIKRKLSINKKEKIRIGYFSADFRYHPVSLLISKLLKLHNRTEFEIYAFSFSSLEEDFYTEKIKKSVDKYFDIKDLSNDQIVDFIRSHDIDIAIDLMGYTENARTSIFSSRVAPIQINYLGFSGSMGAKFMDYIIADKVLISENEKHFYDEQILYLKQSAICIDDDLKKAFPKKPLKEKISTNRFVFVCFNNNYKISPDEFDIWGNLLRNIEESYLWLKISNEIAKNNLIKEANKRGINSSRLIFANYADFDEHINRHSEGDLFLDTFNYNAGSTAVIALLSGLPLLTLYGKSYHSRMSSSLLKSIDMDELIAYNKNEYEEKAYFLATKPEELKKIREKLNCKLNDFKNFNTNLFTKELEIIYKSIYSKHFQ